MGRPLLGLLFLWGLPAAVHFLLIMIVIIPFGGYEELNMVHAAQNITATHAAVGEWNWN